MATKEFNLKIVMQLVDRMTRPIRKASAGLSELGRRARAAGKGMRQIGSQGLKFITAPLALLAGVALRATASIEQLEVSFESMLGSADAAKGLVKQLTDFTARTPFQLEGVGTAARQLLAFGVGQDEVLNKLKFLGDIAAGAKVPLNDMAAIFGKVKAKGKAMPRKYFSFLTGVSPLLTCCPKSCPGWPGMKLVKTRYWIWRPRAEYRSS